MKATTVFDVYNVCRSRQESIVSHRRQGCYGVAVNDDEKALEWQRLERIAEKCKARIIACLDETEAERIGVFDLIRRAERAEAAAEALAVAAEKASNVLGVFIDRNDVSTRGAARAALRELDAALVEYQEATR